jgi:hypothetical protein
MRLAMWRALFGFRIVLATALLLAVAVYAGGGAIMSDWRSVAAAGTQADLFTSIVRRYDPLISSLPRDGTIGYLQTAAWGGNDVLAYFLAAYALTPRIVVPGTAPDFVVVVPEASVDDGERLGTMSRDSRLAGFALYARFANGLRIFRRVP